MIINITIKKSIYINLYVFLATINNQNTTMKTKTKLLLLLSCSDKL